MLGTPGRVSHKVARVRATCCIETQYSRAHVEWKREYMGDGCAAGDGLRRYCHDTEGRSLGTHLARWNTVEIHQI